MTYQTFTTADSLQCRNHCSKRSPPQSSSTNSSTRSEAAPQFTAAHPQFCHTRRKCGLFWPMLISSGNTSFQTIHLTSHLPWCKHMENQVGHLFPPLLKWGWQEFSRLCGVLCFTSSLLPVSTVQISWKIIRGRNTR